MQARSHHHRGTGWTTCAAIRKPAAALAVLLLELAASPSRADCGPLAAEVDARCYSDNLQAAVDEALSSDRPLLLPRGTYRITRPLVIDYATHAAAGFELISRGAIIDGTSISDGPAVKIQCSGGSRAAPIGCFYFHQEGTLFVNARSSGYAVVIGKPDLSDAHNSIKFDHLIVNNNGTGGDLLWQGTAQGGGHLDDTFDGAVFAGGPIAVTTTDSSATWILYGVCLSSGSRAAVQRTLSHMHR